MKITESEINGLYIVEPTVYEDSRGHFFESYNQSNLKKSGLEFDFIQDNQSKSQYGVIRGLHFQKAPHAQTKLIRVVEGKIFDVAVDLRRSSPDFGKWFGIELSSENKKQLLIPKGFAHGFSVLSKSTIVVYKCDEIYHKESENGISYKDPDLNINWKIPEGKEIISEKDNNLSNLNKCNCIFDL